MKKSILLIFDIDGTLINSTNAYHKVITSAMTDLGILKIDTNFNALEHHTDSFALKYNYEAFFKTELPLESLDSFEDAILNHLKQIPFPKEINGAHAMLSRLRQEGYAIAFATGSLPKSALLKMKAANLWIDENVLATSKTSFNREGFVLDAIEKAKSYYKITKFSRIISIGDGLWDLKTANNLNLEFIGIGDANKSVLKSNGMKHWFQDFSNFHVPS